MSKRDEYIEKLKKHKQHYNSTNQKKQFSTRKSPIKQAYQKKQTTPKTNYKGKTLKIIALGGFEEVGKKLHRY